jgi:4'-phosphopantetheinyl transferase EntD
MKLTSRPQPLVIARVDIELDAPLPNELTSLVCRRDEDLSRTERSPLLRFVAKEAFFKAYFPETREFLDFHDVHVELNEERGTFVASLVSAKKLRLPEDAHSQGSSSRSQSTS